MERQKLSRDIVGHIDCEDLYQVRQANERAEQRGPRNQQKDSTQRFGASSEDLIGRRRTDGIPQHPHWSEVTKGLNPSCEKGKRHLVRNDFCEAVTEHFGSQSQAKEEPEPPIQKN